MTTITEVEEFLADFKQKLNTFDIVFFNRLKNVSTLLELGIIPDQRIEYIKSIEPVSFSSGPNKDTNDTKMPDYWVFGMVVKDREIYIKINMGKANKSVICMSFHISEYTMDYPLK